MCTFRALTAEAKRLMGVTIFESGWGPKEVWRSCF